MKKGCRTADDVTAMLALPVLAAIPVMLTAWEQRQVGRRRFWFALAALIVIIGGGAAVAWVLLG